MEHKFYPRRTLYHAVLAFLNKMDTLVKRNWYAAGAHALSFAALLGGYLYYKKSQQFAHAETFRYALPYTDDLTSQCNSDRANVSSTVGQCSKDALFTVPEKTNLTFNVIYGCLAFFAISALAHVFYATDGFNSGAYSKSIQAGWNPYRWVEYGISASLMTLLIGHSLGTKDAANLSSLVILTASLQSFGFIVEAALKERTLNRSVVTGATLGAWVLFVALWAPIVYNFRTLARDIQTKYDNEVDPSTGKKVKLPGWVWFILIVQIINYASFGIIQLLQVRSALAGKPKLFSNVESQYLTLSFAGKLGLAGGLGYGLLFRTKNCN
jgi:hypothetical protein